MKHIIRFNAPKDDLELEADTVAIQPPGLIVLVKDQQIIGTFNIGAVAGVWTPDGPSQVVLPAPGVQL